MSAGASPIVVLLMIVLVLLAAGLVIAVVLMRRGVRRPSCGACGYAVAGLDGLTCPECGADLREAGIVTPTSTSSPWLIPLIVAMIWSIGLAIVASILTPLVYDAFPRPYETSASWLLTPSDPRFGTVTIDFAGAGTSTGITYQEGAVRETLPGQTQATVIEFDLPRLTQAGTGQTVDESVIATWLMTNASNRPADAADRAAVELLTHIRSGSQPGGAMMIQGPAIYSGAAVNSGSKTKPPPNWLMPSMVTAWCVVWLLGLWPIMRWYRKQRAMPAAA